MAVPPVSQTQVPFCAVCQEHNKLIPLNPGESISSDQSENLFEKYAVLHPRTGLNSESEQSLHQYHWSCLRDWFESSVRDQKPISCPECRAELIPKERVKFGVVFQNGLPVLILNMPAVKNDFNSDVYLDLFWNLVWVCLANFSYEAPMTLLDLIEVIGEIFVDHYVKRPIMCFVAYAFYSITRLGHPSPYSFQTWIEFHCRFLLELGRCAITYSVFFLLSYAISDTKTKNIFGIVLSFAIAKAFSSYSWKMQDEMALQRAFKWAESDNDFQKYFICPRVLADRQSRMLAQAAAIRV
jgi:hypothetical protein